MKKAILAVLAIALLCVGGMAQADINPGDITWSVVYGHSSTTPRDNRGIAVDLTGQYLYLGNNNIGVNKVKLADGSVTASVTGQRGKSIAVDDQGRVYTTGVDGESIKVYDANLTFQYEIASPLKTEGIAIRREGGVLALYATERNAATLTRFALTESGGNVTGAVAAGLDGDGVIALVPSTKPDARGVGLAPDGTIWVADPQQNTDGSGRVLKYDSAGTLLSSVGTMKNPYYFGFYGNQVLVTQAYGQRIDVLNSDLSLAVTLTPPWAALGLKTPPGGYGSSAISGIAMAPDGSGFYVTYEHGESAAGEDPYLYEPVLFGKFAAVPEPVFFQMGALLGMSGLGLMRLRRKA